MDAVLTWLCVALYLFGWYRYMLWYAKRQTDADRLAFPYRLLEVFPVLPLISSELAGRTRRYVTFGLLIGCVWPIAWLGSLSVDVAFDRALGRNERQRKESKRRVAYELGHRFFINDEPVSEEVWRNHEGHASGGPDRIDEERMMRRERELGIELPPLPPREL